jgi:biotin carboxyl carrier protein
MPSSFVDSRINQNLEVATEYFKALVSKKTYGINNKLNKSAGSIGFIPFNINFTMDGISGIQIYNQLSIDTSFLPPGYTDTLDFIVTGVDHKVQNGDWETNVKVTLIPSTNEINNSITSSLTIFGQVETPPPTPPTPPSGPTVSAAGAWKIWSKGEYITSAYRLNAHHSEPIDEVDPLNTRNGGWTKNSAGKYIYDVSLFRTEGGIEQNKPLVPSPINGTVTRTNPDSSGNAFLTIKGNDGLFYDLLHMDNYLVSVGDTVTKGQLIARQSNVSPPAFANHLHMQMPTKQALIDYIYNLANNSF